MSKPLGGRIHLALAVVGLTLVIGGIYAYRHQGMATRDTAVSVTAAPPAGNEIVDLPEILRAAGCEACGQAAVIPAGSYTMGSPENEHGRLAREGPQHVVKVQAFEIGRTEVTQAQWRAVMGPTPATFVGSLKWSEPRELIKQIKRALAGNNPSRFRACGDACPVDTVSWTDAQRFIRRLNAMTGSNYRLPTEAEWEYAARAGTTTPFWWGRSINSARADYNGTLLYENEAPSDYRVSTVRADAFEANGFGLYNMHGNVWEWMQDCWSPDYSDGPADGAARLAGDCKQRVERGGSWIDTPANLRAAFRTKDDPEGLFSYSGFRLARSLPSN